ncbi:surfeit locus protein 6 homolog [Anopheles aquasalis]|uniref:surfeit locus protein 6 homolog n=1 Tax=Anopheles aquasalis TaxID=42839 RepID=UPI00215B3B3F|nr:surfeit locus protein 6 homolog [Anopheles aquasalis]
MGKKVPNELLERLQQVNDEMEFYMDLFQLPESNPNNNNCSEYLLEVDTDEPIKPPKFGPNRPADTAEELEARMEVMKNKITARHLARQSKQTDNSKAERKKLKKEQQLKKKLMKVNLISAKQEQLRNKLIEHKPLEVKKEKKAAPTFNAEGKIVFSKFQLDEHDKPKKGLETDKKKLLKKVLDNKKHLSELKESGDIEKYAEVKQKQAWEKAMAKTAGQKVRDDPELLVKKINERKKQIKKSKKDWEERKAKVEEKQAQAQKKRTTNLQERAKQKKNKKLQKMAKRGRIIPGF